MNENHTLGAFASEVVFTVGVVLVAGAVTYVVKKSGRRIFGRKATA